MTEKENHQVPEDDGFDSAGTIYPHPSLVLVPDTDSDAAVELEAQNV